MSAIAPLTTTHKNVPQPVSLGWSSAMASRLADYIEIAKPRISLMVLLTVTVGYFLSLEGAWSPATLVHAWIGIALVAMGSSALNQWIERETDGRMRRTMNRPLPSGRLSPAEVLTLGFVCGGVGTAYLAAFVNGLTLFAIVVWIIAEAIGRLNNPLPIEPNLMLWVAAAGLAVNVVAFAVLHGADRDNLNVRGALLHVAGDLLGSIAAIVGAIVIMNTSLIHENFIKR